MWIGRHGLAVHELRMHLCSNWHQYRGGCVAILAQLPNLRHLEIAGGGDFLNAGDHLRIMRYLPRLLSLSLEFRDDRCSNDSFEPLRHLTALTRLGITIIDAGRRFDAAPALAKLLELRSLKLACTSYDTYTAPSRPFETISQLTNLTNLSLYGMLDSVPAEIANLQKLQQLHLQELRVSYCSRFPTALSFPATLALCSELRHVSLMNMSAATVNAWWGVCRSLLSLPVLESLRIADTDLGDVASGDWALSSKLMCLELSSCQMGTIPAAVCELPHLQHLTVTGRRLKRLDGGAYLNNLRSMTVQCSHATDGWQALNRAMNLTSLIVIVQATNLLEWSPGEVRQMSKANLTSLLPASCSIFLTDRPCHDNYPSSPGSMSPRSRSRSLDSDLS